MVTTDLQDVLFTVDLLPVYTVMKKKPELFAGYAVVNLDENKVLKTVSDRYELRTNEVIIDAVKKLYPISFDFAHFDNKKSYFHIYFTIPTKVTGQWQWAIEIINAYDCKTAPKVNVCFKHIVHKNYTFTNHRLMMGDIESPHVNPTAHEEIIQALQTKDISDIIKYGKNSAPEYVADAFIINGIVVGMANWLNKSHQSARNWLAEGVDYLLTKAN